MNNGTAAIEKLDMGRQSDRQKMQGRNIKYRTARGEYRTGYVEEVAASLALVDDRWLRTTSMYEVQILEGGEHE